MFITGRRQEELDAAVKTIGGQVTGVRGDMSKLADIDRLYDAVQQKHSQIDVLFANAGGGAMLPLGAITEEHYRATSSTRNVKGVLFTVQKALPLLNDGASMILTGSTAGVTGTAAFSVYRRPRRRCAILPAAGSLDLKERGIPRQRRQPRSREDPGPGRLLAGPDAAQQQGLLDYLATQSRSAASAEPDEIAKAVAVPGLGRLQLRHRRRALRRWRPGPGLSHHAGPGADHRHSRSGASHPTEQEQDNVGHHRNAAAT